MQRPGKQGSAGPAGRMRRVLTQLLQLQYLATVPKLLKWPDKLASHPDAMRSSPSDGAHSVHAHRPLRTGPAWYPIPARP